MPEKQTEVAPTIQFNADGSQSIVGADGETALLVPGVESEENLSPAMRLYKKLQSSSKAKSRIEKVTIEDQDFFVLRLNFAQLTKVGLLTPRTAEMELDLNDPDNLTALSAAMMFCAVVSGEDDDTPFFDQFSEAWLFANSFEPATVKIADGLFGAIAERNPSILEGTSEGGEGEAEPEKKSVSKKPTSSARRKT